MPAPTGTWRINANCENGSLKLEFTQCNQTGSATLNGTWLDPSGASVHITGFWNEEAQKLTFLKMRRNNGQGDADTVQVFTGYLMTGPQGQQRCALAGTFEASPKPFLTKTVATCERCVFGWYALPA
jgi:hypothetical protein